MDYLQYIAAFVVPDDNGEVLNLVINGLPSIHNGKFVISDEYIPF